MAASEQSPPSPARSSGKRVISFSCGLPTFIACILGMIAGIAWVFFLGVLLGRGLTPEARLPHIEKLMPQATPLPAPLSATPAPSPSASPIPDEDLDYRYALKNQPVNSRPASPNRESDPTRASRPRDANEASRARTEEKASAPARGTEKPREEKKPAPKKEVFDYVYQVASSRNAAQTETLAAKLRDAGIKARMAKAGSDGWNKVLVDFRGSPEDTDALRKALARQSISRILLTAKTPVR